MKYFGHEILVIYDNLVNHSNYHSVHSTTHSYVKHANFKYYLHVILNRPMIVFDKGQEVCVNMPEWHVFLT